MVLVVGVVRRMAIGALPMEGGGLSPANSGFLAGLYQGLQRHQRHGSKNCKTWGRHFYGTHYGRSDSVALLGMRPASDTST